MKILKITFQNLNSLKGEHSIDLENGLLGEAGIFSITGPTGAGKSTILDAITLALFGKAARYEKESNPGEMMTRGTGECSAEVLFECSQGRYTSKWARIRARKKPDGKLQNPKREIAKAQSDKADSGEILTVQIREADNLIESLTGLDYHRFLRSVLLAQGRFKEFLDADDNERGDLLEKITGTEIYSRISQKAFEFERVHAKGIEEATQRLGGVELKSEEALRELNEQKVEKTNTIKTLRTELDTLQKKVHRFDSHRQLAETLEQSKIRLEKWTESEQAFAPTKQCLKKHEATQPFQPALIEIAGYRHAEQSAQAELKELTLDTERKQREAAQLLVATSLLVQSQLQAKIKELANSDAQRLKTKATEKGIAAWLKAHQADRNIEAILPEIRALGESVRQTQVALQRSEKDLRDLQADQLKNNTAQADKKSAVELAQKALSDAKLAALAAIEASTKAAEDKSITEWKALEKKQRLADQSAQALHSQRTQWKKDQSELTQLSNQGPSLKKQLKVAQKSLTAAEANVAKESAILEDKQKIWDQARLIAKLESHRADLKPDEACPLCGSLEHPYAEHFESDEDANKQAVQTQKQVLASTEKSLKETSLAHTRFDEKSQALDQQISKASKLLAAQSTALAGAATTATYQESIEDDAAFSLWLTQRAETLKQTEVKMEQLEALDQAQRASNDKVATCDTTHRLGTTELKTLETQKAELAKKEQLQRQEQAKTQKAIVEQLVNFNQKLGQHFDAAKDPAETLTRTKALEEKLTQFKAKLEAQAKEQHTLIEIKASLKELQETQARLDEERAHWQKEIEVFTDLPDLKKLDPSSIAQSEARRRSNCQAALDAARLADHSLKQKTQTVAGIALQIKNALEALTEALIPTDFDSMAALVAARLTEAKFTKLSDQQNALKTEREQLRGRITQTEEALKKIIAEGPVDPGEATQLKAQSKEKDEAIGIHNKRLGEIDLLLEQDNKARLAQAGLIEQIKALEIEARPWIELSALIGSASGDKFSKFAQGLTLAQLLELANRHLLELNDRYQIQRTDQSELSLQIVDRYQADAIRPTRSLSGGESFLVSLALALGLSDLAGSDTRIESLFIDEGFGTLDTNTLDTALAALENLRMSNRTIGIISHVDALKQRISAQIRVEKASNGYGTLEVINEN